MKTSTSVEGAYPFVSFTDDNLSDVIRFIKEERVVVLHTIGVFRIFHMIPTVTSDNPKSLENVAVIYLDCNPNPELLRKGSWADSINEELKGVYEVADSKLKEAIKIQTGIYHRVYFRIQRRTKVLV